MAPFIQNTKLNKDNVLVNTVTENELKFTKREIQDAVKAHKLSAMVGNPSDRDLGGLVKLNLLKKRPITAKAVGDARKILDQMWLYSKKR